MKADLMQVDLCNPAALSPVLVWISSFVVPALWLLPCIEVDPEGWSLLLLRVGRKSLQALCGVDQSGRS